METYEEILERMKQTFAQQAGYEVEKSSDLEIRMQVLAGELYSSFANIEWLKRQVFPQTATGEYLSLIHIQMCIRDRKIPITDDREKEGIFSLNFMRKQGQEGKKKKKEQALESKTVDATMAVQTVGKQDYFV